MECESHLCGCPWWWSQGCPSGCQGPGSPVGARPAARRGPAPQRSRPRSACRRWMPRTPQLLGPEPQRRPPHLHGPGPGRSPEAGRRDSLRSAVAERHEHHSVIVQLQEPTDMSFYLRYSEGLTNQQHVWQPFLKVSLIYVRLHTLVLRHKLTCTSKLKNVLALNTEGHSLNDWVLLQTEKILFYWKMIKAIFKSLNKFNLNVKHNTKQMFNVVK